jgi:uncharacterized membrane protein YqiK
MDRSKVQVGEASEHEEEKDPEVVEEPEKPTSTKAAKRIDLSPNNNAKDKQSDQQRKQLDKAKEETEKKVKLAVAQKNQKITQLQNDLSNAEQEIASLTRKLES